jgi:hypothetical protein
MVERLQSDLVSIGMVWPASDIDDIIDGAQRDT